jgi:hypothetical protein
MAPRFAPDTDPQWNCVSPELSADMALRTCTKLKSTPYFLNNPRSCAT